MITFSFLSFSECIKSRKTSIRSWASWPRSGQSLKDYGSLFTTDKLFTSSTTRIHIEIMTNASTKLDFFITSNPLSSAAKCKSAPQATTTFSKLSLDSGDSSNLINASLLPVSKTSFASGLYPLDYFLAAANVKITYCFLLPQWQIVDNHLWFPSVNLGV